MRKIAKIPIILYRRLFFLRYFFSFQHGGPCCRYYPTCSSYMSQAIDKHGVLKGGYLGAKRLARCHPWSKHIGHDPVPEKFEWLTTKHKNKEKKHA